MGWPGWPPPRVCAGGCVCAHACGGGGRCVAVRGWPRPWPEGGRGFGQEARRSADERGDKKRPPARAAAGPHGRLLVLRTRLRPAPLCLDAGQASMWLPSALLDRRPARRAPRLELHPKNTRAWTLDPAPRRRPTPQKRAAVGAPHPLPPLSTLKNSEAFAAWLPPFGVPLSYAIAIGYVLVDTVDKGLKAYARAKDELEGGATPVRADVDTGRLALLLAAERTVDTVVWQLLASVFVPGYTIHTVVAAVHAGLGPLEALPAVQEAAAGLASAFGAPSGAALLAVADKSLPTVAGLAGAFLWKGGDGRERERERERERRGVSAPSTSPPPRPPPLPNLTRLFSLSPFSPLSPLQPSPSSSTPSTMPSTPCSTSPCAPP